MTPTPGRWPNMTAEVVESSVAFEEVAYNLADFL
jgi:hypothetical protein